MRFWVGTRHFGVVSGPVRNRHHGARNAKVVGFLFLAGMVGHLLGGIAAGVVILIGVGVWVAVASRRRRG